MQSDFTALMDDIRRCDLCASELEHGPRPVVRGYVTAKILIIGQAPGSRVHASGIPWDDASGERLRDWLMLDEDRFYDQANIAIMPMGFCYPGKVKGGGDKPPRPECAPKWHQKLLKQFKDVELTLLIGSFAQAHYLENPKKQSMTDNVRDFDKYLQAGVFPLPHPSWRVRHWLRNNPWFESDCLPILRQKVANLIS
ncbi:MAG: uracil-DNA glycosylase family protein [Alphaproteobacteria bacterium]|nr:uracil-DNA glycosylase family protein [Alphaproteobacteria bacterium]